jgi:hypothetical protein
MSHYKRRDQESQHPDPYVLADQDQPAHPSVDLSSQVLRSPFPYTCPFVHGPISEKSVKQLCQSLGLKVIIRGRCARTYSCHVRRNP